MNFLDKAIYYVFPSWGYRRQRLRTATLQLRKYEAAANTNRTSGWSAAGSSADAEILPALARLRNRARDLCRNNEYALKARRSIAAAIVGSGIVPQVKGQGPRQDALEKAWESWGEKKYCDADELSNFYGLQTLICNAIVESGACLVRRIMRPPTAKNPLGLEIQVLEPDFVDLTKTKTLPDGGYIRQGIEYSRDGKRVAYWLYRSHPGDVYGLLRPSFYSDSIRVAADDLAYIFYRERPGQTHGVPWLSVVAVRLKDFGDFEDAHLVRQKIAACFAAFVEDIEVPETEADKAKLMTKVEPGRIEFLPPGKRISFASPPGVSGYGEYSSNQKHAMAAGLGITYERLSSDLSQVNFSSARMGQTDMNLSVDQWQWQMLIPQFCEVAWEWFVTACELAGLVPAGEPVGVSWTPPKKEFIDPTTETAALKDQVRSGFKTLSEAVRESGYDPLTHFQEYAADMRLLDELKLSLDTDPRKSAAVGAAKMAPGEPPKKEPMPMSDEEMPMSDEELPKKEEK